MNSRDTSIIWALVLIFLAMVWAVYVVPTATYAQNLTPSTSISQLNYPAQATTNSPITVTFAVSYNMGENMYLGTFVEDLGTNSFLGACFFSNYVSHCPSSASPIGCVGFQSAGCLVDVAPYTSGVEYFQFTFNLTSGTHHLTAAAGIADNNYKPIAVSESSQYFSIVVSQQYTPQYTPTTTQPVVPTYTETSAATQTTPVVTPPNSDDSTTLMGIGLVAVIAIIALALFLNERKNRRRPVASQTQVMKQKETPVGEAQPEKLFCIECGSVLPPGSKFCNKCGSKQD